MTCLKVEVSFNVRDANPQEKRYKKMYETNKVVI